MNDINHEARVENVHKGIIEAKRLLLRCIRVVFFKFGENVDDDSE